VALCLAVLVVPRLAFQRAQDRLARAKLSGSDRAAWKILTRADIVVGRYRRLPGLLGFNDQGLVFESLFGDSTAIATSRIVKIVTGRRLASGRTLLRREALRVTHSAGQETEFILTLPSANAWRSHLGLWAMAQRKPDADRVTPGRG
jgi:hypothetical protein